MNKIDSKREMNIEVLRILSMLGIIMMHFLLASGTMKEVNIYTINYHLALTVEAFCYVSVNVYVLISGYFASKSRLKINKILNIWIQVISYTSIFYLISVAIGNQDFSVTTLISRIMPISSGHYWFVTVWLVLYILSTALNFFIKSIDKKAFIRILITLILIFSIWPIVTMKDIIGVGSGYTLYWFITIYLIGGFIGKYKNDFKIKTLSCFWIYIGASVLTVIGRLTLAHLTKVVLGQPKGSTIFLSYNAPLVLIASVALFMFFVKSSVSNKLNKLICFFSASTFGVYLIHMNLDLYPIIFKNIIHADKFTQSPFLILYGIGCIFVVFVLCALLDKLRNIIFEKCKVYSLTKCIDKRLMLLIHKYENKWGL